MKSKDLFIEQNSIAVDLINEYDYPFEVLSNISNYIIKLGSDLDNSYIKIKENVWIANDATISDSACIIGPCIIDHNAEIRNNAFIRDNVIIGKNCVVGNSSEIKNSILFDEVQVPHFNYVGDSILGYKSHLGAGVVLSNLKNDKSNVIIKGDILLNTNLQKVGSFIADRVEIGCNSVLNPGTIVGANTFIYPLTNVKGVIPSNKIVKNNEIIEKK